MKSIRSLWVCAVLLATPVNAHSPLETTSPADGAIVAEVPAQLELGFKGEIRLTRVRMTHAGGDQTDLDLGEQTNFRIDFSIPFADMGPGVYLFEWRGLGSDGHAMTGTFSFTLE